MMVIRPLGNALLLGPLPQQTVSDGGIHLVNLDKDEMRYYVVACGPKVKEIEPGDKVLTPLYFDHVTLEDGTGRKLVDAKQVIAVWK